MSPARFSVNQVVLVNLAFVVIMLAGLIVTRNIPVDIFPDISFNSAVVITVWPGASADEVERMVTTKIEDEVREITGIKQWSSFSSESLSQIDIEWDETMSEGEQQAALNALRAAIDRVQDLPEDVEEPWIKELSVSETFDVCMIAITDQGGVGEYTLREFARKVERKVERIAGVRKGRLMGARERELRVYIDKDRAFQHDGVFRFGQGYSPRYEQGVYPAQRILFNDLCADRLAMLAAPNAIPNGGIRHFFGLLCYRLTAMPSSGPNWHR